jgi:superfamily II DNA or RNA helicase
VSQLGIWDEPAAEPVAPVRQANARRGRYYQEECDAAIEAALYGSPTQDAVRSCLVVMATGLGKTYVFSERARRTKGRVLVIAHRDELIVQARDSLASACGEYVGTEKAEARCGSERLVVSSIQTMHRRLDKFKPDHFELIVIDEAHRAPAESYCKVMRYFTGAKILGVTATPDRTDERAMGAVFDTVAYVMDIENGIEAGYLVPVHGQDFAVDVDLSNVSTSGGDYAQGELDEAMLKVVESVVDQALRFADDKQVIVFTPGVKSAHAMCERANLERPGCSIAIDGGTDPMLRKSLVQGFKSRKYQFLWNCNVATEGFDAPETSVVAIARPTKSRALFAQMCGRGTRVLPGTVDHIHGPEGAAARRAAIAASAKPHMTILNFVEREAHITLRGPVTPVDVLGGNYTEDEVKEAKRRQAGMPDEDIRTSLKVARNELAAAAKALKAARAKVTARVASFDPFQALGIDRADAIAIRFSGRPATEKQVSTLVKFGLSEQDVKDLDFRAASRLLGKTFERMDKGLASLKQLKALSKWAPVPDSLPFETARKAMDYVAGECQFGRRRKIDAGHLESILRGS